MLTTWLLFFLMTIGLFGKEMTKTEKQLKNVKLSFIDSDVYYLLDNKNSDNEIYRAIRKSSLVWHFLAVLTRREKPIPPVLTKLIIDEICENLQFVIGSAYDGEGYIFWKKTKHGK